MRRAESAIAERGAMGDGVVAAAGAWIVALLDPIVRESALLAAALFAIGGIDDLLLDVILLLRRRRDLLLSDLAPPLPDRLVIFVPAWHEDRVIGAMLRRALATIRHDDYRIYVGCYPNDAATIAAVDAVARTDERVRLTVGPRNGPTTKADCLNAMYRALCRDEAGGARRAAAVILHDAEDVVDADELCVHASLLRDHALVQVPVVPLIDRGSRWIAGHYVDEFADAHGRQILVRAAVGAALPLAGVGCAIRRDAIGSLGHDEAPFDEQSLTEDYEIGLQCGARGLPGCFARVRRAPDAPLIATRGYFPNTLAASVRQKARWMTGIAFAGWDRTGWGGRASIAEWWMRMRDRRGPLAVVALAVGYLSLVAWGLLEATHLISDAPVADTPALLVLLLRINTALLLWRLVMRAMLTGAVHGWREGVRAIPRVFVANIVAMMAARRALVGYVRSLAGAQLRWEKTPHHFPDEAMLR